MIRTLTSCFIALISLSCLAQDFVISGRVKDENDQPIAYANIILQTVTDSTYISGTTSNETGYFKIENVNANKYILKISFLGFEEINFTIDLIENLELKSLILKEKNEILDGVTLVGKRPTIKRLVDRLVFNVESSTLSNNNILDVVKYIPGIVLFKDEILFKGGEPAIYINDRKVYLSPSEIKQLLEGSSAANIKSIELITNPPSKYEAGGNAVLNIITNKNIIAGYNGSVFGNYKQGSQYPKYALGTSHFFKAKKISAYLNYNISPRNDFKDNHEFINFIDDNEGVTANWKSNSKEKKESSDQIINASLNYELDEHNSLGLSTNILLVPRNNTRNSVNSITEVYNANKVLDSTFNSINESVTETYNFGFTLDYVHKFNRVGEKLYLNAHHTNYDYSIFQDVNTGYFLPNTSVSFRDNNFQTFSSQKIKIYTSQADYELPINTTSKFETGVKLSHINSNSNLTQYIFNNDNRFEDLENSDAFKYDEMNYALYASYTKDWENWSIKSGLRIEHTDITGISLSNIANNNSYFKFFPSLHLLHKLNDNNELYFNYNKRIYRPRYDRLNPFKFFLNDYAFISGDPNLKPQIDDQFTLGYTLNKAYTFEVYYRNESDPILLVPFQDNENNLLKYLHTNIDSSVSYGIDFYSYTRIKNNWNINIAASLFYYDNQFFALESNNELFKTNKWSSYLQVVNYFTFLQDKSLTADVAYLYISPFAEGPSVLSTRSSLDISLRKTLWDNKASISIGITDLFNRLNFTETLKYLNQDAVLNSRLETRLLTIGFNYKFGNLGLRNNQKGIDLDERDRLINKD